MERLDDAGSSVGGFRLVAVSTVDTWASLLPGDCGAAVSAGSRPKAPRSFKHRQ